MTKYKVRTIREEQDVKYEVFLGFCSESEKLFTSLEGLIKYFQIQKATGREIEDITLLDKESKIVHLEDLQVNLEGA